MASSIASAIDAVALVSSAASVAVLARAARRPPEALGEPPWPRALWHPWTLFLLTSALALANQVLFDAYVLAAHQGDPSFIGRYVGTAYFHLDLDFPFVRALAHAFGEEGASRWLAPSLLRVNALLELPFAALAYLAIARLFDRAAFRFLLRSPLGVLGAASFTVILCLIELRLRNPWTEDDLVLRGVSFVLFAPALVWLGRRERGSPCFPASDGPRSLSTLLIALVGAAAMAGSLLLLYDVTLLYNLAHLRRILPLLLALLALGTAAAVLGPSLDARRARRPEGTPPPASVAAMTSAAAAFSLAFFVPSLAIRYGLGQPLSRACGLALLVGASLWGLFRAARGPGLRQGRWLLGLLAGALAGALGVLLGRQLTGGARLTETALVVHAVLFLGPLLFTWRVLELLGLDARQAP